MKKIYLALTCMASLAIVTACGGGNAKKNAGASEQTEQTAAVISPKDVTVENWAQVMKGLVGIELDLPDGWVAKRVEGTDVSFGKTLRITFGTHEDAMEVGLQLFDKCNELTKKNFAKIDNLSDRYKEKWETQLSSKLEDHPFLADGMFSWELMYDEYKTATVYYYRDYGSEIVFNVPNQN